MVFSLPQSIKTAESLKCKDSKGSDLLRSFEREFFDSDTEICRKSSLRNLQCDKKKRAQERIKEAAADEEL